MPPIWKEFALHYSQSHTDGGHCIPPLLFQLMADQQRLALEEAVQRFSRSQQNP